MALERLTADQRSLLDAWLPGAQLVQDHSWGLVETTVLELAHAGVHYIAKAAGEGDHHLERELRAHRSWLVPWTSRGRAPVLVRADLDARILLTRHLAGQLVEGSRFEDEPDTYRQAGTLLAQLHDQERVPDPDFEARENAKAVEWLGKPHRIAPDVVRRLRAEIASWPAAGSVLVPTHGDWQPRNWLIHDGVVSAIDFGRADLRPAMSDFARLASRQFRRDPALEAAFLDGYGTDPRAAAAWHRQCVREAIGTAVWAHLVGDEDFEAHGHRMIADALARTDG